MPGARKRSPGRTKTCSWRGIIIITIITGGIATIIIITGIITTTITTITGSISVDDGAFENLGLMRSRRQSLDSQKA
jgi:type IV secretory pathway VirB2 component (pilin)